MADGFVPIFKPSGTGHRAGAVPDPIDSPSDYVLRADATWGAQVADAAHQQHQVVGLTIAAGDASATGPATFAPTFAGPPQVWTTADVPDILSSASGVTLASAVIEVMAAVAVIVDTPVNVNVLALYG
jgi:hypothetical protein